MQTISIVVPVFNEEDTLAELRQRLTSVIDGSLASHSVEILLVDDGSTDRSLEIASEFHRQDQRFKVLSLSRNFGHQAALLAGISAAQGSAIVVMDADLQDPPELIPEMVRTWTAGADVVHAQRRTRKGESFFKRKSADLFYRFIDWLSDTHIPRDVGDFRLIDRRVVDVLMTLNEKSLYLRGLVAWVGFNQSTVLFDRDPRFAGETKYTLKNMLNLATDALISFSERPLRVVTKLGLLVTFFAFGFLGFFLVTSRFAGHNLVPGWLSLMTAVLLLGGVQLICLGIIGQYVSRVYRDTKGRPLYIVDDKKSHR